MAAGLTAAVSRKRVPASKRRSDWEAGFQVNATSSGQIDGCYATKMHAECAFDRRERALVRPISFVALKSLGLAQHYKVSRLKNVSGMPLMMLMIGLQNHGKYISSGKE